MRSCTDSHCGALVLFVGMTRQWTDGMETQGKFETLRLEYEAYREMAISEMKRLEEEAFARWPVRHVGLVHRLGRVDIGEASVAVAVASPHRDAAFEAAQWLIDELKKQVPIWKKEMRVGEGSDWVHPTNMDSAT